MSTPKRNSRSGSIDATVAVACATLTGWILMVGEVTPTPTSTDSVSRAMGPNSDQTNGDSPCVLVQEWK